MNNDFVFICISLFSAFNLCIYIFLFGIYIAQEYPTILNVKRYILCCSNICKFHIKSVINEIKYCVNLLWRDIKKELKYIYKNTYQFIKHTKKNIIKKI